MSSWQVTYAKICWRCVQDGFEDGASRSLSADCDGEFVSFIRAMAEFASGKRIESGFGGAAKVALAWGKMMDKQERLSRKFLQTGEPPEGAAPAPAFHLIEDAVCIRCRAIERCKPAGAMDLTAGLLAQQLAASHPGRPATN